MIFAASLWIVREVRMPGERLALLEGRSHGWQNPQRHPAGTVFAHQR